MHDEDASYCLLAIFLVEECNGNGELALSVKLHQKRELPTLCLASIPLQAIESIPTLELKSPRIRTLSFAEVLFKCQRKYEQQLSDRGIR